MSDPAQPAQAAAPQPRRRWSARVRVSRPQPWWLTLGIVAGLVAVVALIAAAVAVLSPAPTTISLPSRVDLDDRWGTYLSEREWGTPREAVNGNVWGMLWTNAIGSDYQFGQDGIAGVTDKNGEFNLGWAFWDGAEDHVTERFRGLGDPQTTSGAQITDDRVYHENEPHHAYQHLTYLYPPKTHWFSIELEMARYDSNSLTMVATVTNTTSEARSLDVLFKGWLAPGGQIESIDNGLLLIGQDTFVAVVGDTPSEWQIVADKGALDANLRGNGLVGGAGGNNGALAYRLELPAGANKVIRVGVTEADLASGVVTQAAADGAAQQAGTVLKQSAAVLAARRDESTQVFADAVSEHGALYRQALMSTIWNETYYTWDGSSSSSPAYAGLINAHDVLILPDKWEYPYPESWAGALDAVTAALIDPALAQAQLRFYLSDRWQQPDGHIPCDERQMDVECPPIFAWAAWRVYERSHDTTFLTDIYPALQRNYDYWWSHNQTDDALFAAGSMGMENLPRPIAATAQADASAWMAFFARDMARIASELHDPTTSQRYWIDRGRIQEAINTTLWDESTGFYYDAGGDGTLFAHKSYSGIVPLIAGVVPPERLPPILAALRDPNQFLGAAGIRSLAANDPLYSPGAGGGGVNSNWRGPVWVPLNYLLVEALGDFDPSLAVDVRDAVVDSVEADWTKTGRLHEFFDGTTGEGLGADNAGWTALVANFIADGWPAQAP